ncbi:MAG: hypothetical protein LBJ10_00775 [Clostridiales bacterium]|nr:hypothetical protein [Clostridiales bacterium]
MWRKLKKNLAWAKRAGARPAGALCAIVVAAVLLAAVAVSPAPASLASVTSLGLDYAAACGKLGLLEGEGAGLTREYLDKRSTRIQTAYLTLRLVGKQAEADRFSEADNFSDVGDIYEIGRRRAAYLKANSALYGWQGDGTNRLMPHDSVTAQQFYKVLLTVLGYQQGTDFEYAGALEFADSVAGMSECRYVTDPLVNDDIAIMMVEALLATMKGQTYTLAEFLAEEGVIDYANAVSLGVIGAAAPAPDPTPAPPAGMQDVSIATDNFAEINITFSQPIDPKSIDRNFIKIDGSPLADSDAAFVPKGGSGDVLRIYRENGFTRSQGAKKTLALSKIRSLSGAEMPPIAGRELTFMDNQTPSLVSVDALGTKYVRLTFSEPVDTAVSTVRNYTVYKFNGRTMNAALPAACFGREVYLSFITPLDQGANALSISTNTVYDLATFPILDVTNFAFDAQEDRTAPQVLAVDAYREKVRVTFSEEVKDQARLYWLDGSAKRYAAASAKLPYERETIEFTFQESLYLPVSSAQICVEYIADMNGNAAPDYTASVAPQFDSTRPEVLSASSSAVNEIVVEFSKPVKLGSANDGRFALRNSNGVSITLSPQAYTPPGAAAADPRFIRLAGAIAAGDYTLTVANVEDTTAQANRSAESTHQVSVRDNTEPAITSVAANIPESKVVLTFSKPLDWASASDRQNYEYNFPGRGHVAVPADTSITLESDGRTVVVAFPPGGWVVGGNTAVPNAFSLYIATNAVDEMRVLNIADTYGNKMQPRVVDVPSNSEAAAKLLPSAYAVSPLRVMMRFDTGALPVSASASDFIVRTTNQAAIPLKAMSYNSIDTVKREIYLDLADGNELNSDGTYGAAHTPVMVYMVPPASVVATKTALGTPLEIKDGGTVSVTDNLKPGRLEALRGNRASGASAVLPSISYPALSRDQILVAFDERVQFFGVSSPSQLNSMVDVYTESQPTSPLNPTAYSVEAYTEQLAPTVLGGGATDARFVVVTLRSGTNEAVNVAVRANYLWDSHYDANGQYIMNNAFETGFLPAMP